MKKPTKEEQIKVMKLLTDEVSVERRIHKGWEELKKVDLKKYGKLVDMNLFGKYQYIYSNSKGKISLVRLRTLGLGKGTYHWEIYCLESNLFEDIERFKTKKEAEKRIYKYLGGDK